MVTEKYNLKLMIFIPEGTAKDVVDKLESYGTEIKTVPMAEAYEIYKQFQESPNAPHDFNQMFDDGKKRHYLPLARAINQHLKSIDVLLGTVGTGHSLSGLASGLSNIGAVVSAEPLPDEPIAGIRNLDKIWFGEKDPCCNFNLDSRVRVPKSQIFPATLLETSLGPMEVSESFQLALGALPQLAELYPEARSIFIVGAKNKRLAIEKNSAQAS